MDIQLKKGVTELVILNMLKEKDMYGYDINNKINHFLEINKSTVYAILQKLVNNKHCTVFIKELSDGPVRKYYHLTSEGKHYLKQLTKEWEEFNKKIQNLLKAGTKNE